MNIVELGLAKGRGGSVSEAVPKDGVRLTVQNAGGDRKALVFDIGVGAMQTMRWVIGDKLTIDLDCAKSNVTLRRVVETDTDTVRWTISGKTKNHHGKVNRGTVKVTTTPALLSAFGMEDELPYTPSTVTTDHTGITFPLKRLWKVTTRVS